MSKTTTQVTTRVEVDVALRQAQLTSEEEKVLRMRYGMGMAPDALLQAHTAVTTDAAAQIEALEKKALAHVQRQRAVIDRLRRIDR